MSTPSVSARRFSFEGLYAFLSLWFIGGIYTDGWAHNHLPSSLETFFTPWHAALYSGFAVCALALFVWALRGRAKGAPVFSCAAWRASLPEGWFLSLVGAAVFAFGGGFDFVWHSLFGIEKDLEALVSPAHLVLAVGAFLMLSGPIRAAWHRRDNPSTAGQWASLAISFAATLSVITFMTMFAHPIRHMATGLHPSLAVTDYMQGRATAGFLFQMTLLTGLTLLAVRRWGRDLPPLFFGFIYGLNMLGMSMMLEGYEFRLIPAAIVAGLVADGLNRELRPSERGGNSVRWFAALVPASYSLGIFLTLLLTDDVWWSVHMWTGTVALSAIVGLLISVVAMPPRLPDETAG